MACTGGFSVKTLPCPDPPPLTPVPRPIAALTLTTLYITDSIIQLAKRVFLEMDFIIGRGLKHTSALVCPSCVSAPNCCATLACLDCCASALCLGSCVHALRFGLLRLALRLGTAVQRCAVGGLLLRLAPYSVCTASRCMLEASNCNKTHF